MFVVKNIEYLDCLFSAVYGAVIPLSFLYLVIHCVMQRACLSVPTVLVTTAQLLKIPITWF